MVTQYLRSDRTGAYYHLMGALRRFPVSQEPAVPQLKRILDDFLESGSKCSSTGFSR
jgi:hypothetical protein